MSLRLSYMYRLTHCLERYSPGVGDVASDRRGSAAAENGRHTQCRSQCAVQLQFACCRSASQLFDKSNTGHVVMGIIMSDSNAGIKAHWGLNVV